MRNLRFRPDRANSSISLSPPPRGRWASRLRPLPLIPITSAPHPPFGHLLPASGEKADTSTACASLSPPAGRGQGEGQNHRFGAYGRKKGDEFEKIPSKIKPRHVFSSPTISTLVDSALSRPRIHLTMRCQARRGRRRRRALSQVQTPGPLQRSPSGRGAGNQGDRVGCSSPDTSIGRTCLGGTQTRRPRRREHHQTAGRQKRRG
ncbi:hypothetical protein J2045_001932 [Peteryoungia aggregata LMG 23059]|uniref:Uncharacterized protein n=1 Tax=Peteryoungia aggregata LMG 23059 TaxID=1368425 RepID=A0ABU0G6C8_9HYPH|nr:hypothetical protein [Peteryoungia aggregata LMG 23059]